MNEKVFDEIVYLTLHGEEIEPYKEKISSFLLNLTEERKTLFYKELPDEDCQEIFRKVVGHLKFIVLAKFKGEIIGVNAFTNGQKGLLYKLFPTVSGFVVVSKNFQGKGIGTKLVTTAQKTLEKTWAFNLGQVRKNNLAMIKIDEKHGWKKVPGDDTLVHFYYPCRKEMRIISHLFWISYWINLRSKRVRELLHTATMRIL